MVLCNDSSSNVQQVRGTRIEPRLNQSTSPVVEPSAHYSHCQYFPQRSSPCRLFIASTDQLQRDRCVICGFQQADHISNRDRSIDDQPLASDQEDIQQTSDDSPWHKGSLSRTYCSDWNISTKNSSGQSQHQWNNSYDVRGEYLSKEDFRSKYGNYFANSPRPSVEGHSNGKIQDSERKFYYHRPAAGSGVYYYTDQDRIIGSNGDPIVEQRFKSRPISAYWSDSEHIKRPIARDPVPLTTFRPLPGQALAKPVTRVFTEELSRDPPVRGQVKREDQQCSVRPSVVDYGTTFNANLYENESAMRNAKKKSLRPAGVSFRLETAIIGNDGGAENFSLDSPRVSEEIGDGENDDPIWIAEPKTEFETLTEINTEFNGNRRNFLSKETVDSHTVHTTAVSSPATASSAPCVPVRSAPCDRTENKDNGTNLSLKLQSVSNNGVHGAPDYGKIEQDSSRESTPIYAAVQKIPATGDASTSSQVRTGRKGRQMNPELEEKLQRMARDLEGSRITGPAAKPKAPPPPPPPPPTLPDCNGSLRKSISAFLVSAPSPAVKSSASNLMTSSMNGVLRSAAADELGPEMTRSFQHQRCLSVDVTSPSEEMHQSMVNKGNRQSRSRFASIRKFLRMPETPACSLTSVRRSDHGSSSTNCSTISWSSNGSSTFSSHGGFHSFKLPLLGRKTRGSLNTVKGLFHGANECHAVGEIAQDTDVIVTEITEIPSANNTLVRACKRNCGLAPLQIDVDTGSIVLERLNSSSSSKDHSASNGTASEALHDNRGNSTNLSSIGMNHVGTTGHEIPASSVTYPSTPLREQQPLLPAASANLNPVKVKRAAPPAPTIVLESDCNGNSYTDFGEINSGQLTGKDTEPNIWRMSTTGTGKSSHDFKSPMSSLPPSPAPSRPNAPSSSESLMLPSFDDRYDQLISEHVTTLSHLIDHFPTTTRQCRRKLSNLGVDPSRLSWSDFTLTAATPTLVTETSAMYPGALKLENSKQEAQSLKVDLMVTPVRYSNPLPPPTNHRLSFFPPAVAEFQDYVPSRFIKLGHDADEDSDTGSSSTIHQDYNNDHETTLCKIVVLPRVIAVSIEAYSDHTSTRHRIHRLPCVHEQAVCFIMIQFISALKYLQSKGVEEIRADLDGFLLFRTATCRHPQLILCCESFSDTVLSNCARISDRLRISLCQGALAALCQLLHTEIPTEEIIRDGHIPLFARLSPYTEGFQKAAEILRQEKPNSLTQAKSLFEYMFWVNDQQQNEAGKFFENEQQARWWLDRERARFVCYALRAMLYFPVDGTAENGPVNSSATVFKLDILDEYRGQFLLHATAKSLMDAAETLTNDDCGGEILL